MKKRITSLLLALVLILPVMGEFFMTRAAAGNTFDAAATVGLNSWISDSLLNSSDEHYYKFTLNQPGYIRVYFWGGNIGIRPDCWVVFIYTPGRDLMYSFAVHGHSDYAFYSSKIGLAPGTYYIAVKSAKGGYSTFSDTTYTMKVGFLASNYREQEYNGSGFNNTFYNANTMTVGTKKYGNIMTFADEDYYKVSIPSSGKLSVSFQHEFDEESNDCWHIEAYNPAKDLMFTLDSAGNSEAVKTSETVNISAGTYFFAVKAGILDYSFVDYNLKINFTPTPPAIISQPTSKTVTEGKTASFTVGASGTGLTYQWEVSKDGGKTWSNSMFSGSKTKTLSFTAKKAYSGLQYRCVVKNQYGGKVTTNAVKLTVIYKPEITMQPVSKTATAGNTVSFTVAAKGSALQYQWKVSKDGGKTWSNSIFSGSKTKTLSFTAKKAYSGLRYCCVVTNSAGSTTTQTVRLTVQ